jgi:hypothetical protein
MKRQKRDRLERAHQRGYQAGIAGLTARLRGVDVGGNPPVNQRDREKDRDRFVITVFFSTRSNNEGNEA